MGNGSEGGIRTRLVGQESWISIRESNDDVHSTGGRRLDFSLVAGVRSDDRKEVGRGEREEGRGRGS
jgi:hypothetical protein